MRINEKMKVRNMADEHIVVEVGRGEVDMTRVMALNESGLLLYRRLQGREFEVSDVARLLCEEYEVGAEQAERDATEWVEVMVRNGLIV